MEQAKIAPKVFISYSWSSPGHCDLVRGYAERLISDGVDVTLDQWGLSEGQDKYAFMEKMVSDPSITHVIIFSDQIYAQKADSRKAGVGTESQIISKEVYDKIEQRKFIPVVCQKHENNEPCLPVFLASRIWIDFSTPESVNENWEKLLRAIYDKPIHMKPALGKPPSYLENDESRPALPTIGKFSSLRDALMNSRPAAPMLRKDFLDAAIEYADLLRIRTAPDDIEERVIGDVRKLHPLREQLVDWLLIEATVPNAQLDTLIIAFLERILPLKYRPKELNSWNEGWFDAHAIFVYEIFIYTVAVLIATERFEVIHELLTTHYLLPDSEANSSSSFDTFERFCGYSRVLHARNDRLKLRRVSLLADMVKENATHKTVTFADLMQAELLIFLMSLISNNTWFPHTIIYAGHENRFPLFVRAAQHKHFEKLKTVLGISSADEVREKIKALTGRMQQYLGFEYSVHISIWDLMKAATLDTIK